MVGSSSASSFPGREEREGGRKGDLHVAALSVCRSVGRGGPMDGLCERAHTLLFPVPPFLALVHVSRLSLALFPASAATTRWLGYMHGSVKKILLL